MAEGEKLTPTNSRAREERVFRDNSEREGWNCERRRKIERRKINEDRAKRDPSYVYFEEIRIFPHFFQFQFFFFAMENEVTREATFKFHFFRLTALIFYCCGGCCGGVVVVLWWCCGW